MVWRFNTVPHPGEYGYETWPKDAWKHIGGANSWSGMSMDEKTGIVYIPTGSASPDFYGGNRKGENLFANSLLSEESSSELSFYTGTFDVFVYEGDDQTTLFGIEHKNPKYLRSFIEGRICKPS